MEIRPGSSIEQRKQAVRQHSRSAVVWTAGGVVGGIAVGLLASSFTLFVVLAIIGIAGGVVNWRKVQNIVNHKDQA